MPKNTITDNNRVVIGEIDLTNFIRTYIKGYKFINGSEKPKSIVIPKVLFVDDVLVEYQQLSPQKEVNKDAKAK